MKKLLTLVIALFLLAACQPTPEVDAVRQKNSAKMIEMAQGTEAPAAEAQPEMTPAPIAALVPEKLHWDFYSDVKNVHVMADAPIRLMTEDTFPLLRVAPRRFNGAENVAVAEALLGTDTVYKSVYQLTRKDLEKQISDLMTTLSDPLNNRELLADFDREELENELIPRWQKHLEELQEQYRTFQDGDPIPNPLWDGQAETENQTILVTGKWDKESAEKYDSVYFFAREGYPSYWSMNYMKAGNWGAAWDYGPLERIDPVAYDTPHAGVSLTPRQAAAQVQEKLAPFVQTSVVDILWGNSASDTYGSDGTKLQWAYVVRLMPAYYGTATGVGLGYLPMSSRDETTNVSRSWQQEYIMGVVNDGGVLNLNWMSPLTVTEVVTEHANLLPFSEIETVAQRQINRKLSYEGEENGTLEVTGVRLGLLYTMEQNVQEGGLLVPAWIFLKAQEVNENQKKLWNGDPSTLDYDSLNPLVIINAVDGTIIDPFAGY